MHDPAIELLVLGNSQSEVEGYLTALRNSGRAAHAKRIDHDLTSFTQAIDQPIDLILYTCEAGEIGVQAIQEILENKAQTIPLIALADTASSDAKAELMSLGVQDLVDRSASQLLVQVISREYSNLLLKREYLSVRDKLTESEEQCKLLTEHSRDAIAYIHEGMHVQANSAYLQKFGFVNAEEIEGLPILDMVVADDHQIIKSLLRDLNQGKQINTPIASRCVRMDGTEFDTQLSLLQTTIDGEPCIQITLIEQQSSQEVEEKLRLLSTRDSQTGLYNRHYFLEILDEYCQQNKHSDIQYELLYITLDNFKQIRDQLGLLVSDVIINETASLLQSISTKEDVLARFGDHTFTLLSVVEEDSDNSRAETLRQQIEKHAYPSEKLTLHPTCSIGIVRSSGDYKNANEFINAVYQACEQARIQGGNRIFLSESPCNTEPEVCGNEADLDKLILHALETEQFRLLYQPIVSLHGDTRENYAVLVRLLDNHEEEIRPSQFMAQTESLGKIQQLDRWVIRKAIAELSQHRSQGKKVNFFINISGASLEGDSILLWICDCLQEFEAKGSWLAFQIHESEAKNRLLELRQLMEGLKKIKCKIAIDQFGNTPKPTTILDSLPIDYVQFAPSLIDGLIEDQDKQDILFELNTTIQAHNVKTIAAGIDETNSLAVLWSVGVNYIRGYFIQEPTPSLDYDFKSESPVI